MFWLKTIRLICSSTNLLFVGGEAGKRCVSLENDCVSCFIRPTYTKARLISETDLVSIAS